jgi:hypothetical protein
MSQTHTLPLSAPLTAPARPSAPRSTTNFSHGVPVIPLPQIVLPLKLVTRPMANLPSLHPPQPLPPPLPIDPIALSRRSAAPADDTPIMIAGQIITNPAQSSSPMPIEVPTFSPASVATTAVGPLPILSLPPALSLPYPILPPLPPLPTPPALPEVLSSPVLTSQMVPDISMNPLPVMMPSHPAVSTPINIQPSLAQSLMQYAQTMLKDSEPPANYPEPSPSYIQPSPSYLQPSPSYLQPPANYLQPSFTPTPAVPEIGSYTFGNFPTARSNEESLFSQGSFAAPEPVCDTGYQQSTGIIPYEQMYHSSTAGSLPRFDPTPQQASLPTSSLVVTNSSHRPASATLYNTPSISGAKRLLVTPSISVSNTPSSNKSTGNVVQPVALGTKRSSPAANIPVIPAVQSTHNVPVQSRATFAIQGHTQDSVIEPVVEQVVERDPVRAPISTVPNSLANTGQLVPMINLMGQFNEQNLPDYDAMSLEEQAHHRANFITKFGMLREGWPSMYIPILDSGVTLRQIHAMYNHFVSQIHIQQSADGYKQWMVVMWYGIEVLGTRAGLNMNGYAKSQMSSMSKYERLLIELGENKYKETAALSGGVVQASSWPVEMRLLGVALLNALIFVIVRTCMKYLGGGSAETQQVIDFFSGRSATPGPAMQQIGQLAIGNGNVDPTAQGNTTIADPPMPQQGGGLTGIISNLLPGLMGNIFGGGGSPQGQGAQSGEGGQGMNFLTGIMGSLLGNMGGTAAPAPQSQPMAKPMPAAAAPAGGRRQAPFSS